MPEVLSSPELLGDLGLTEVLINEDEAEEMADRVAEYGEEIVTVAQEADEYDDLLTSLSEVSHCYWGPVDVEPESEATEETNIGEQLWYHSIRMIASVDETAGTENEQVLLEFINELEEQQLLSKASLVAFLTLGEDQEFLLQYGNSFVQKAMPLAREMIEIDREEEVDLEKLVEAAQECGPLIETAIPPVITIVNFLRNGKVEFEKVSEMSLRDAIDFIDDFEPLSPIAELVSVDLRNAVQHGGKNGGYNYNPMLDRVQIWYRRGETHQRTFDAGEFERLVLQMMSAVVTLFLVPFTILTAHITVSMRLADD